jgi:putative Holliday junction resolvase
MALDLGDKRTGLAVGSDAISIVSPAGIITANTPEERLRQIGQAIEKHGPNELVIGLPLNMDGSEGGASKKVRELAALISKKFSIKVHLHDERLTSFEAEEKLNNTQKTRGQKKAVRDALAAQAILEDFMRTRKKKA